MRAGLAAGAILLLLAANGLYAATLPDLLARMTHTHPIGFIEADSESGAIAATFQDVTQASGIEYHRSAWGEHPTYPQVISGGVAAADVDGNGWMDLYFPPGGGGDGAKLYLNHGGWNFTDATEPWGLGLRGEGAGASFGDYDNDGDADLYVGVDDDGVLWRNDGGIFQDVTAHAGVSLRGRCGAPCQPSSVIWSDVDRDGWLDLAVVNNLDWRHPRLHSSGDDYSSLVQFGSGQRAVLWTNGHNGTFSDGHLDAVAAKGLGITSADLDGDGASELLVANDASPNQVLRREEGAFQDIAPRLGADLEKSSMGIDARDLTGDGRPEVVITQLRTQFLTLLVQRDDGTLRDEAVSSGLAGTSAGTGWGVQLFDADLDGQADLAQAVGRPAPLGPHKDDFGHLLFPAMNEDTRDQLFRNVGQGRFVDATAAAGFADEGITRALLAVDLDGDGDQDVVRVQLDGAPAQVLRNDILGSRGPASGSQAPPGWLQLRFQGFASNRAGIGAVAQVTTSAGTQTAELASSAGYQTGLPPVLSFGLGEAQEAHVVVRWPSGAVQDAGTLAGGAHTIQEPRAGTPYHESPPVILKRTFQRPLRAML